ncbi:MAG TPA: ABC transporter permease subunit, partial [Solirubrobacteraceae bacterium]|nr:ABC transporter permease subunit [Solirubrobacteraceae bacterium]
VALGILLALAGGLVLVGAIHLSRSLRRAVYPLLVASQTVPVPVFAPLLVAWLGYDLRPKVAIVALICFFPIVVSTLDALATVEPELLKLMRTLGATRWQTFRRVEAPSALPGLLSGTRIAVVVAVIGAVFAEYAGSADGLGHLIQQATAQLQTPRAWAAVVMLSVLAGLLFAGLGAAGRLLLPWAPTREEPHP